MKVKKVNKNDFYGEYIQSTMPNSDREYYDIDGIKDVYQEDKGFFKVWMSDLYCFLNPRTEDWLFYIRLEYLEEIETYLWYFNKALFEVKVKVPPRSVYRNNPLVYKMKLISIIPFQQTEIWKSNKDKKFQYIPTNTSFISDDILEFSMVEMEGILKEIFISKTKKLIENKSVRFTKVSVNFSKVVEQ